MTALAAIAKGTESRQLFDFDWTFTQNGKTAKVNLPHDWDIYAGPNSGKGATGTGGGWFEGGIGEYRKEFRLESLDLRDKLVKLQFEGVYQKAEVFINGQKAGQHAYGYTPFTVDITPYLYKDKRPNEVVVRVNNSEQPNCRWYSGSGIYRHVWLEVMPKVHIAENGMFITTDIATDGVQQAKVDVQVTVVNEDREPHTATVQVEEQEQTVSLNAGEHRNLTFTFFIKNPHLWSPDDPYLYTITARVLGGSPAEPLRPVRAPSVAGVLGGSSTELSSHASTFGIRSFSFDAERGFMLNGRPLLLNGACLHHDDGVLGAMAFDAAEIRKVRQMKEAGFNLIRTSHNPTSRAFLDACDSIGMLVIDEAFDGWRQAKNPYDYSTLIDSCYREDIHAMVMRDRNHPCVISWSIGNEVMERKDLRVITTARQLKAAILECDPTRPVTEALCAWDSDWEIYDPHFEVLDIGGYNYMIHKHASDHLRDPNRVMWQTESYPRDAFRSWTTVADNPYVIGDIVWTGLDYLGESGIGRYYYEGERPGEHYVQGGQPDWHGAYCGDVDITGWRKPISHYREMLWKDGQSLYLAVREPDGYHGKIRTTAWSVWPTWESWTWPGWEGKPINVEVYTKAPEVTLYLNDKEIGRKAVSRNTEYKAVFSVPYEPGILRAEARGTNFSLATAGSPARLKLTADRSVITADGQDLAYITLEVLDREGRVCPEAAIPCEVSLSGSANLLAAASADLKDTEPYTSPRVTTWKGRALIVVRSAQKKGQTKISVKSTLPTAAISITQR
ncbi:MAG: DUF4982 domain-containing protein [Bacteroidaceae bacterium]|nr:DUF4982 domain-containing protein [Bacteroidaceae bacterium]